MANVWRTMRCHYVLAAIARRLILTCGESTAIVWRNHCVQISCTHCTSVIFVKSSHLSLPSVLLGNVFLNPCRSSSNIASYFRKKFLKESPSFSRNTLPQGDSNSLPEIFFQHLAKTLPTTCEVLPPFPQ